MAAAQLEHANITVSDPDRSAALRVICSLEYFITFYHILHIDLLISEHR